MVWASGIKKAPLTNEEAVKRFLKYEGKIIAQVSNIRFKRIWLLGFTIPLSPLKKELKGLGIAYM
jgi:hypothetical protein